MEARGGARPAPAGGGRAEARQQLSRPARQTAGDQAEAALFEAIMEGRIRAGAPLPAQELAEQLGMSAMPVREALRRLASLGLVEIVPHKGAWVRELSLADLRDTYFTRIGIESLALREAAAGFGPADGERARAALRDHEAAVARGDRVLARDAHERFHFALYRAARSDWLMRSLEPAWRNSERYRVASMRDPGHVRRRAEEHLSMLAALERGDGEAAAALLAVHLRSSADLVAAGLQRGAAAAAPAAAAVTPRPAPPGRP